MLLSSVVFSKKPIRDPSFDRRIKRGLIMHLLFDPNLDARLPGRYQLRQDLTLKQMGTKYKSGTAAARRAQHPPVNIYKIAV